MVRAIGDINYEILSLISPLGLILRVQVYVQSFWWPVLIILSLSAVVMAIAFYLNSIRDMDQGFISARPGKKEASPLLKSPFGLTLRLLRNMLIAWVASIFIFGASYGAILGDIENFVANSDFYSQVIGSNPNFTTAQMFVSMVTSIMSLLAIVPVLTAVLKIRSEEKEGRAEHVLSRVVSRTKYLLGYVMLAFVASILVQCAIALGIYSAAAAVLPDPGDLTLGYLLEANLVYLPAIWAMIGITVLLIGLLPKASSAIWGYFGFTFFAVFMARIPGLIPDWLAKTTPFGFVPQLPVDSVNYTTLAVLTVIAIGLTAFGFVAYRKRDMTA